MNRISIVVVRWLVAAALLFAGSNFHAQAAPLSTAACGSLPGSTTWTLANTPYAVCGSGVTIPAGSTLTIEPGVTVQFDAIPGNKLNVQGALVANGTPTQGITFTGVSASPGSWGGISAVGTALVTAQVSLNYVTLDYGGIAGSSGAQVYADHAVVSLTNSLIRNSAGNGVLATLSALLDAHNTSFVDNAQDAVLLNQPSTDLLMTGLSASGNAANAVHVSGSSVFHGLKRWTDPGIPFLIDGPVRTDLGDTLSIDPGSELQFTSTGWLYIRGRLNAFGTPDAPILLTAQNHLPGGWTGLFIDGGLHQAVAQLDYVTIEYGGSGISGANIEVANGKLLAAHSIIRSSAKDGVRFDSNYGGVIQESQVVSNALYGVRNVTPQRAVLATNNWWGDAGGPQSDVAGCSTGLGAQVTAGVLFLPVRAAPDAPSTLPLSSAPNLTVTPRRWFAPADNVSRVYFDITVQDGNGAPLSGRKVRISSTLGNVTDGGITDAKGNTLAFIKSTNIGDAVVTASIDVTGCEMALSPETTVTFTAIPAAVTDLMPDAPSSYFDGDIQVNPIPVIAGVDTTITAKLTNPLATSVTVDVAFNYADAGIGLVFGPIDEIFGQVIPGNSSITVSAHFIPPVSGHFCVLVTYSITAVGLTPVSAPLAGSSGSRQKNLIAQPGSMGNPSAKETLARADKAFKGVSKLPSGPTQIQKAIVGGWWNWVKGAVSTATTAMGFDPPRQDYNQVTMPVRHPIPHVLPGANSVARAAALNAVNDALTDVEANGTAAATAMDRYGGATAANNMQWASEQANELIFYQEQLGIAMLTYADSVDAFVLVLQNEAETDINVTVGDITAYQLRLTNQGFTPQEIADAKSIGWTDAQIETQRLEIIAAKPADLAGNLLTMYTNEAAVSRDLANSLLHPTTFQPSIHVSGSAGLLPAAPANSMAQVYNTVTTIQLANPLLVTSLIDVKARRIGLPADWTVDVSPLQVSLAPGEQTTVTVTVIAGSPVPQGSLPRVAVEGFTASQLLGGVVIDVLVPRYAPFDGKLHVFLPQVRK